MVDVRLSVFHCCAGSMLGFRFPGSGGIHTSQGHAGKVVGAALAWLWRLCRAFSVVPELCKSALVNLKSKSHPIKCNNEDNRLRSISLITLQFYSLRRCMCCGRMNLAVRLLYYFESHNKIFAC